MNRRKENVSFPVIELVSLLLVMKQLPLSLWYKWHLSRQYNCWSLRCSWSIANRRCSNYIFILHFTPGFNGLGKDNYKTRRDTFMFRDWMRLIYCDSYKAKRVKFEKLSSFELQTVSLSCGTQQLVITCVYLSSGVFTQDFSSQFSELLSFLQAENAKHLIVGDFNFHVNIDTLFWDLFDWYRYADIRAWIKKIIYYPMEGVFLHPCSKLNAV